MRKTTLGKKQKGRQKDEFGENSWKTFHITGKARCPEQWNTTQTQNYDQPPVQMLKCKMPVASTIRNSKYRLRHKQDNV